MAENIIDPNNAIASPSLINLGLNATPDYSDMFIFAELTVQRRGSSILETNGVGKPITLKQENDSVNINLMGFDNDTGQYTTRWSENIGTDVTPFEGFGMTSIKIATNSSYVPTVDIEFVDIRGLSLVSLGTKSKYSVLYSFPPPIYTLTLKGYYGKALTYELHMVKQSTRFDAASGNYFINVNLIARRYTPLTDVLFKYIDIVPMMKDNITAASNNNVEMNFNLDVPPKNTRELITRAKRLYVDIDKIKNNSKEANDLDDIKKKFVQIQTLISQINNFKDFIIPDLQSNFDKFIINRPTTYSNEQGGNISTNDSLAARRILKLEDYDDAIKGMSPNANNYASLSERFCLLYEYDQSLVLTQKQIDNIVNESNNLKLKLLNEVQTTISTIDKDSIELIGLNEVIEFNKKKYIGLDISVFYLKVRQDLVAKQQDYTTKNQILKDKISDLAEKSLGFPPTIRNIFSIFAQDVSEFFRYLREVCENAEEAHKSDFNDIKNNNETNVKFISAFPLVIHNNTNTTPPRKERAYPGNKEVGLASKNFPEVDFVEKFIQTFINLIKLDQLNNMKESVDANGNNIWIPVNPLDSLINGRTNAESPYKGVNNVLRGPNDNWSILDEIINRLYITSQYSYGFLFYHVDANFIKKFFDAIDIDINTKNDKLIQYTAQAEATNLINSIVDTKLLNSLEIQVNSWSQSINDFYNVLDKSVPHYSDISENHEVDSHGNDSNYISLNGQRIVKNRASDTYRGFELLPSKPDTRNGSNNGTATESDGDVNLVDKFINGVGKTSFFSNLIFDSHGFDDMTKQNIPYILDKQNVKDHYKSDFITTKGSFIDNISNKTLPEYMSIQLAYGDDNDNSKAILYKNILNDSEIDPHIKAFIMMTNLCGSLTFYHNENDINKKFAFPAVIEVPKFAYMNMGAYMYFYKFSSPEKNDAIDFFENKYNVKLIPPTDTYAEYALNISDNDADLLLKDFNDFVADTHENGMGVIINEFISLIDEVIALNIVDKNSRREAYQKRLEGSSKLDTNKGEKSHTFITDKLISKQFLLNYTQITFLPTNQTDTPSLPLNYFVPLKDLVNGNRTTDITRKVTDNYFKLFFQEVLRLIKEKKDKLNEVQSRFNESVENNDIKTQTYYSFKAIADKWLIGLHSSGDYKNNFIDEFKFVDRFFNDIGDKVIIDFRPIVELSQDYDVSVFTVMSRILALNGFEFFPVQNFMNFESEEWKGAFKTYGSKRTLIKSIQPSFICMYIGGTSAQLDDPLSGYPDDGIATEKQLEQIPDYNRNNVKGFKVSFAKQNQSMFTSITLNTNEHKETNESLAILSEIAQDQSSSSPVPMGQNLYSTYEQRSYSCTVEGLGNVMIQPTQYFILENVPMFNGAYLILNVEHNIVPNNMKTSFMGVRIRANANPFVDKFSTATGLRSGSSDAITNGVTNQAAISGGNTTSGAGFVNSSIFPVTPSIKNDMITRLLSPPEQ